MIDLSGVGGKEKEIHKLFPELIRESRPLYNFIDPKTKQKIEIKKTSGKQLKVWVDPMKFIKISEEDKKIIFRVVRYNPKNSEIFEIFDTTLEVVIDKLIPQKVLEKARELIEVFPKRSDFQFKLLINLSTLK